MTEHQDHNALLLQVMAHDLLAPLTAIKWQVELLEKNIKDKERREKYLRGLAESTELGIALSKHAHVAGKVLSHSYEGDSEQAVLSTVVAQAVADLKLQYERHALTLKADIVEEVAEQAVDVALTKLYIWSVAKFFLTCCAPGTEVQMEGARRTEDSSKNKFVFTVHAGNIPTAEGYAQMLTSQESSGNFDQSAVFSKLINETASVLQVTVKVIAEGETLSIVSEFV